MKYIIVSSDDKNHYGSKSNLGHELFFTRKITLILLLNNVINNDFTIVTSTNDRKCLYNNIFKNVITCKKLRKISHASNDKIIDLCPYLLGDCNTKKCLKDLGLNENMLIKNKIFQNCNTKELADLCCKIQYVNLENTEFSEIIKNKFCLIHIRSTTNYLDYLLKLIDKLSIKCIIFTQKNDIDKKYLQTPDLQIYASLLNNKNCTSLLTEWSGAGQLSQFCCQSKVIYYFDFYPPYYSNDKDSYHRSLNDNNLLEGWDHYTPINCKKNFLTKEEFENSDNLLNLIIN